MNNRNDEKLVFTIKGDDYKKLLEFQKKHEQCLDIMPNMTGAQYEYTFIPDGLGLYKTVTCVCGETLSLDSDYDLPHIDESDVDKSKSPFQLHRELKHKNTLKLLHLLKGIEMRPGMYFGKEPSWDELWLFICGMSLGSYNKPEDAADTIVNISEFSDIVDDVKGSVFTDIEFKRIKKSERFKTFFERLWKKIKDEYPDIDISEVEL